MKDNLGFAFLHRTLKTSGVVILVFLPFGIYYLGFYAALAVFSGAVWGMVNFIFLGALVRSVIRPEGADRSRALWLGVVKFPLLYLAGYCLLITPLPGFTPGWLLAGFSVVMAVMVLKAVTRVTLKLDTETGNNNHLQEAR